MPSRGSGCRSRTARGRTRWRPIRRGSSTRPGFAWCHPPALSVLLSRLDVPVLMRFDPRRALVRTTLAGIAAVVCAFLLSQRASVVIAALGGWVAGGTMLLVLILGLL